MSIKRKLLPLGLASSLLVSTMLFNTNTGLSVDGNLNELKGLI